MTPGLAGFVASGADAPAWDEVIAGVMTALAQGFTVVPEHGGAPGGARRRTLLDTFDWRLYRAGLATGELAATVTVPGFPVRAVDSVGAGDTFVGALAVALAAGVPPQDAVRAAAAAGATAATRPGTQSGMPHPADVLAATGHRWPVPVP